MNGRLNDLHCNLATIQATAILYPTRLLAIFHRFPVSDFADKDCLALQWWIFRGSYSLKTNTPLLCCRDLASVELQQNKLCCELSGAISYSISICAYNNPLPVFVFVMYGLVAGIIHCV